MGKLLVLDNCGSFSLLHYLKKELKDDSLYSMGNIYTEDMWNVFCNVRPDIVFVDFCDNNAVVLTKRIKELDYRPRIIIRLHAYEAHCNLINQVDWSLVSDLITVSTHYHEIVKSKIKDNNVNIHVIYNGVDLNRFKLQDESKIDDNAVAYIANLSRKKGISLLGTVISSMNGKCFYVGGRYQEEVVYIYLNGMNLDNLKYCGFVDTAEFLNGKRFILSTSVSESFGMSIAEGMAMGLTPMVHGWYGAKSVWPEDCVWNSFDELKNIEIKDPKWCRKWVEDRYSMDKCIDAFIKLLK